MICFCVSLAGCQDAHKKNKAAAMKRWEDARVKISINMAQEQFDSGDLNKALMTTQSALANAPKHPAVHLMLGKIYLELDKATDSRDAYQQCLEIDPENAYAYYQLAGIFERWKQLEKANEHYQKALELDPTHMPYIKAAVEIQLSIGDYQSALDMLMNHVDASQKDASYYMIAGKIFQKMGDDQQATQMYAQALSMQPEDNTIKQAYAFSLNRVGKPRQALSLLIDLDVIYKQKGQKENWAYLMVMGDCYMQLKLYHQAKRSYEKVADNDPLNPKIWTRLAQVSMARRNYVAARQYANRSLSMNQNDIDALMALGYVSLKQKSIKKAEKYFHKVVSLDPKNSSALCYLGQTYIQSGQKQQALQYLEEALIINPEDRLAKEMIRKAKRTSISKTKQLKQF